MPRQVRRASRVVGAAGGNAAREAFRLTRVAEYELLLRMRRVRMRLPTLLLLLVASLAAVQPLARPPAAGLAAVDGALLGDLRIAICSSHGIMLLGDDGVPVPAPEQEKPACPWCAIGASMGGQPPAMAAVSLGVLAPPRKLHAAMAAIAPDPQPPRRARAACAPRAPPLPLRA